MVEQYHDGVRRLGLLATVISCEPIADQIEESLHAGVLYASRPAKMTVRI